MTRDEEMMINALSRAAQKFWDLRAEEMKRPYSDARRRRANELEEFAKLCQGAISGAADG